MRNVEEKMERIKSVLFDFDGVVADTALDITSSVNAALGHFGYKKLSKQIVVSFVGNGAKTLLEKSFHASVKLDESALTWEDNADVIFEWYKNYYRDNCMQETRLYAGLRGLLESLKLKEIPVALVTNKPKAITDVLLERLEIADFFTAVVCPEQVQHIKPSPESLLLALHIINENQKNIGKKEILPADTVMVGDSATDIQSGKSAGMKTCAITGGYGDTKLLCAQKPDFEFVLASQMLVFFFKSS